MTAFSSADLEALRPKGPPIWLLALGCIVAGLTVVALSMALVFIRQGSEEKTAVIASQSEVIQDIRAQLTLFTDGDDCLAAFGRNITETQSAYLTEGLGGLVMSTTTEGDGRRAAILAAIGEFDRRLEAAQAAVRARDEYVTKGAPLPCPLTTPND